MIIIIGLCGQKRVGKDTAAGILSEEFNLIQCAFADPLRQMLQALLPEEDPWDDAFKEKKFTFGAKTVTGRHLLETLGTEWGRELISPDIWAARGIEHGKYLVTTFSGAGSDSLFNPNYQGMVLKDVRFPNEIKAIQKAGGHVIYIAPPADRWEEFHAQAPLTDHPSNRTYLYRDACNADVENPFEWNEYRERLLWVMEQLGYTLDRDQ